MQLRKFFVNIVVEDKITFINNNFFILKEGGIIPPSFGYSSICNSSQV
jgi:hypothetical protein